MALHRLEQITIGASNPEEMDAFYQEINFVSSGQRSWGCDARPDQIRIEEAPYRQLISARIGCEDEADLAAAATRLDALGIEYTLADGRLVVPDPINKWTWIVEPTAKGDVPLHAKRVQNFPGERNRIGQRAEVLHEEKPRAPRRLGHFVVASPEPHKTIQIALALGFRISDSGFDENVAFMRCSHDHHNLLVTPGPVPYLNHYAIEHDDFDSVFRAATLYLAEHGHDVQISGPGRHPLGGNIFWYLLDPAGNFFEYFADIDQIVDDEAWEPNTELEKMPPDEGWSVWGDPHQPEVFFEPRDMQTIIEGWARAGGHVETKHSQDDVNLTLGD